MFLFTSTKKEMREKNIGKVGYIMKIKNYSKGKTQLEWITKE